MRRAIPQFLPPKDKLPSVPSGEPPITGRQRANSGPLSFRIARTSAHPGGKINLLFQQDQPADE